MIKTETQLNEQDVIIAVQCDICRKEQQGSEIPPEWHTMETHHSDWGNDSANSYISKQVCSPQCYIEQLNKFAEGYKEYDTISIIGEYTIQFTIKLLEYIKQK